MKLLVENLLILKPQVKLTSDEANCKSGCNSKGRWSNGIMEYSIFNCTVRGVCLYELIVSWQLINPAIDGYIILKFR